MIRKNLFNYLPSFDKEDQKQLKKYLQSPFFKIDSRERVIKLYDYLVKFHPEYDDPKLNNDAIAKKLKVSNVKNLKSILLGCCEEFLIINQLNKKSTLRKKLIVDALYANGINDEYKKQIEFEIEQLKNQLVKNGDDYDLLYHLLIQSHTSMSSEMVKDKHSLLEDAIQTANSYYLYTNLKNLASIIVIDDVVKRKQNISITKDIIETAGKHIENFDANIVISYYIYSYYETEDVDKKMEIYNIANEYSRKNYDLLTDIYRYEVYTNLLNIANNLFILGLTKFESEIFNLNQFWISKKIHLTHIPMHWSLFYFIVRSSNDVKEFDWSFNFIEESKGYLLENEKEQAINICLADTFFKSGEFEKTLEILNKTKFLNAHFSSIGKSFELMSLFELDDTYRLDSYSKNFENYIRRHSDYNDSFKLGFLNFCRYMLKIKKARFDKNISKLSTIEKTVKNEETIFYRTWLLAKCKIT